MNNILIDDNIIELAKQSDEILKPYYEEAERICRLNSKKVLNAFIENRVSYQDFEEINGYGFFDGGRDKVEKVFAQVLGTEDALVRPHIMSGTNAIYLTLSGLLHPGDTMICIAGTPYDPLQEIVGIRGNSKNSLLANGIKYEQIELIGNDFDYDAIEKRVKKGGIKLIEIQRSRGYSHREGISIAQMEKVCKLIKGIDKDIIIMIDNCYGELVEEKEPTEVGADIMAGSLMHNLGGGIATSGGYIAGKEKLVYEVAERLTSPGIGKDLGANYNQHVKFMKGLFFAPRTVCNAIKTAIFTSYMTEKLGFEGVSPKYNQRRSDIVQCFNVRDAKELEVFCGCLQKGSPVDSFVTPIPSEFPAYPHEEVMAAGNFTLGSTIEMTCDAPVVDPYTVYMQGALTHEYGKLGVMMALTLFFRYRNGF